MPIDAQQLDTLQTFYRGYTTDRVMAFWRDRAIDPKHPGYLHQFDRRGRLAGTDKNAWCQGRMLFTFAFMHNQLDPDDAHGPWLELARVGRDFLVNHVHRGEGQFNYLLDRAGQPLIDTPSWFTAINAAVGLAEYVTATGDRRDVPLLETILDRLVEQWRTPGFNAFHHFDLDPRYRWMTPPGMLVGAAPVLRAALGGERVDPVADEALATVLDKFVKRPGMVTHEVLDADHQPLDTPLGRRLNPGHGIEISWFCMEQAAAHGTAEQLETAIAAAHAAFELGWDDEHGGLLGFTDAQGHRPPGPERVAAWGERWDTKIWWVHSEALDAMLTAAQLDPDPRRAATAWARFVQLHEYTQQHFADPELGEWHLYLHRHGEVQDADKGNWIRCGFHLPRNLIRVTERLERLANAGTHAG